MFDVSWRTTKKKAGLMCRLRNPSEVRFLLEELLASRLSPLVEGLKAGGFTTGGAYFSAHVAIECFFVRGGDAFGGLSKK